MSRAIASKTQHELPLEGGREEEEKTRRTVKDRAFSQFCL